MISLLFVLGEAAIGWAGGAFWNKGLGLDKWLALVADTGLGHSIHITTTYNSSYSVSDDIIWHLRIVHTCGFYNVYRNTQMHIKTKINLKNPNRTK